MRLKLQWKLTLIFCILILAVLSVVYSYINTHLKDYLEQRIEYSLRKELLVSKDLLEDEIPPLRAPIDMDSLARRIGKHLELRVTIIGPDGNIRGDSEIEEKELPSVENHLSRPEILSAASTGFGKSKRFSTTRKTYMLYMATTLGAHGSQGYLRLSMPLSEIESAISKMKRIVGASTLLALILTFALGYLLSFMISKPLVKMASIARIMKEGDFSRKTYIYSHDEVGDLARALDLMAEEIKSKMSKISYEEAKLDGIISSMFEGVMLTDNKGEIVMMNPSLRKIFLIDGAPEGKRPIEILRNNKIQNLVEAIIREGSRHAAEETLARMTEEKVIRVNGAPVIKDGKIQGAILVFHDITELRRLERIRQDFVANVSHELRTPLANIKGYAETLINGALQDQINAKEFTEIIYRESDRLAKIIDDLLDIARIESGKMSMTFLPVEVGPVIKKVREVLRKSTIDKSITITLSIPDGISKILADEGRFSQILLNLVDNAIKYTPENGSVNIGAFELDGFIRIDVKDTGVGISEKDIPRIFERFYRVDKARSRELGGTGLGLSIAKHLVQAHGSEIWLKSTQGKGSTFSFTIPKA